MIRKNRYKALTSSRAGILAVRNSETIHCAPGLAAVRDPPDQEFQLIWAKAVEEEMRRDQIICVSGKLAAWRPSAR